MTNLSDWRKLSEFLNLRGVPAARKASLPWRVCRPVRPDLANA